MGSWQVQSGPPVEPELVEPELDEPELVDPKLVEPELVEPELIVPELPELVEPELVAPTAPKELVPKEVVELELSPPADPVDAPLKSAGAVQHPNKRTHEIGAQRRKPLWPILGRDLGPLKTMGTHSPRFEVATISRQTGFINPVARPGKPARSAGSAHHRVQARAPVAPNLLARNFTQTVPNAAWVADVTFVWTAKGWFYLAAILDLFSRRVVG